MKPWMWLAVGGVALYFWSKRSTLVPRQQQEGLGPGEDPGTSDFEPLPQRPQQGMDPMQFESVAGYDDPGKRLAEQLWGYSVSPSSKNFSYKGSH